MSKKLLTLNIGAANVELAEYEAGAKGALTLVNYGIAPLAASLEGGDVATILVPALQDIVRETGIRPGPVSISVSGQLVFPKFAAIPMAGGSEKFEQMVCYEIEQSIPFPIDEMVCDRQVLGDTENGDKSVMIVAAKLDQIEAITSAVSSAGFVPELVDVAPTALTNAIRALDPADESCVIILDIGAKTTSLVIREGDKLYTRSIPIAGNAVTKEIATACGCPAEEAEEKKREKAYVSLGGVTEDEDEEADRIAKVCRAVMTRLNAEVSRSINFYRSQQQGGAPVRLILTGGTALLPQIDQFFAESLGIEVVYFNPFDLIAVGPKVDATALETDAALLGPTAGLAVHQAGLARFLVNLLPPSLVTERAEKAKVPVLAAGGAALVAALVAVMLALNNQTASLAAQREALKARGDQLAAFDRKVTAAEAKRAADLAEAEELRGLMARRASAVQRLNAVRDSLLPGMWIDRWVDGKVTVRYWRDRIKGGPGKTAGEMVVDNLKRKQAVDPAKVKISDMSALGADAAVESFTVEVAFK